MNKKQLFSTIIILIIAIVSSWFALHLLYTPTNQHVDNPKNPDAIAFNVTYTQMDQNGNIAHQLYSTRFVHYTFENSSEFQNPKITIMNPNGSPWHITADSGTSQQGSSLIHLVGNVKLYQPPSAKNTELTITTSKATIYSDKKYVTTDQPVKIVKPNTIATAIGANANMETKVVNLLSNVKETYVPGK